MIGWGLMLGTLAILGCPRSASSRAKFLILVRRCGSSLGAAVPAGRAGCVRLRFSKVQPMVFGEATVKRLPPRDDSGVRPSRLVLMLGLWIPPTSPVVPPAARCG
jgi:hypothetical protein